MNRQAILTSVAAASHKKVIPDIRAGQTVRVSQKIKEGSKERVQNFEGLVIATRGGSGINGTFTVRKIVGGIGVEKIFPLHGQTITKIEVKKQAKVRRSKLYYTRSLRGKAARMKETHLQDVVFDEEAAIKAEQEKEKAVAEAVQKSEDEAKAKEEAAKTETASVEDSPAEEVSAEVKEEKPVEEVKEKTEAKSEDSKAKETVEEEVKTKEKKEVEKPAE